MPDPSLTSDLSKVFDHLQEGSEVRLELADGRVIEGKYQGSHDGAIQIADEDAVAVGDVADIGIWRSTEGPE